MQLYHAVIARRIGNREAAAPAAVQQDVDVLAGHVAQRVGWWCLNPDADHVIGQHPLLDHPRRHLARLDRIQFRRLVEFDGQIAGGPGQTHEDVTGFLLGFGQRRWHERIGVLARLLTHSAGAAAAGLTAERQGQTLTQSGGKDGFIVVDREFDRAVGQADRVRHGGTNWDGPRA